MVVESRNPFSKEKLAGDILDEWQALLNVVADLYQVPAGLITRVDGNEIEILLSSETEQNPYSAGYITHYPDSGWYCERTLKAGMLNLIPNALDDPAWKNNDAAVNYHIVSYIGLPIARPDGGNFGTVCFLDNKENPHNEQHKKLLQQVKRMIELSLRVVYDREEITIRDRLINDLSTIYPICSYCKNVREKTGAWVPVEKYVQDVSGTLPSHGICPECIKKMKLQR